MNRDELEAVAALKDQMDTLIGRLDGAMIAFGAVVRTLTKEQAASALRVIAETEDLRALDTAAEQHSTPGQRLARARTLVELNARILARYR